MYKIVYKSNGSGLVPGYQVYRINETSKLEIWTGLKFSKSELKLITPLVPVATPEEWVIEGSMILQSPTPPDPINYRIVGTTVEAF